MAENVPQSIEVPIPLELWGGLVTEMSPSDLPEGISPDCQDVVFLPGGVGSRPCARGWIVGMPVGTTVTSQKTYVTPAGKILNLILASDGSFFSQDYNTGLLTLLGTVTPKSFFTSKSAFGRELIAFHNNVEGTDIPRTFDGQFFDRATQSGPGAPPVVVNTILPSSTMALTPPSLVVPITSISTTDQVTSNAFGHTTTYYSTITIICSSTVSIVIGKPFAISGNSQASFNITISPIQIVDGVTFKASFYSSGFINGAGGNVTPTTGVSATRSNNSVSILTQTPHNLQQGFQAKITGMSDTAVGGGIASIVIDNDNNPGLATITTNQPHGLSPENTVKINNVSNSSVGGAVSAIYRSGQIVYVSTTTPHNLSIDSTVKIGGVVDNSYNGQFTVLAISGPNSYTYFQNDVDSTSSGGNTTLVWPLNNTGLLQNDFMIVATPTPTTFTVGISYSNGTWTGGTVTFPWNGTFFVTSVLDSTHFSYRQYGPDAISTDLGTVTPYSQISPGLHSFVLIFQTRNGFIPAPSPSGQIVANGGQYLSVSNIALGPPNVIARYLAFTGADGSRYFYIPVPAVANGIQISTSTGVLDNVTTTALLDFADLTLFDSLPIDIPGNNLFSMAVLGPCLGVDSYASRASWFGMKNSIQNLQNLGFEGGYNVLTEPLGWTLGTNGGILDTGSADFGMAWLISYSNGHLDGLITQSAYQDQFGVAIFQPLTSYTVNFRLTRLALTGTFASYVQMDLYSPSTGFVSDVRIPLTALSTAGTFFKANFSIQMPSVIPPDLTLRLFGLSFSPGTQVSVDEIEIFPTLNPTLPRYLWSYINFPENLDLISGVLGATDDDTALQCSFTYRDSFLFLTQAGLHETNDLEGYEPNNWRVREVSNNCGSCGPRTLTTGENFSAWVSSPSANPPSGRGLYIYTGGNVYKLSQEIQPDFDDVNPAAQTAIWTQNDSVARRIYVGLPMEEATAPTRIYVLDYREMDTPEEIASKSPIHVSYSGKMVCSDLSRKWTRWNIPTNCGNIMNIPGVGVQFSIGGGNGQTPGISSGFANSYWFDPTLLTDQDYGQIVPYYTTYFFINHDAEQQFQVGLHRKLYKRYAMFIGGVGKTQVSPYGDTLNNPWPPTQPLLLSLNPTFDIGDGLNVLAERCAFKIGSIPLTGTTDNAFSIGKFIVTMSQEPIAPIRWGAV